MEIKQEGPISKLFTVIPNFDCQKYEKNVKKEKSQRKSTFKGSRHSMTNKTLEGNLCKTCIENLKYKQPVLYNERGKRIRQKQTQMSYKNKVLKDDRNGNFTNPSEINKNNERKKKYASKMEASTNKKEKLLKYKEDIDFSKKKSISITYSNKKTVKQQRSMISEKSENYTQNHQKRGQNHQCPHRNESKKTVKLNKDYKQYYSYPNDSSVDNIKEIKKPKKKDITHLQTLNSFTGKTTDSIEYIKSNEKETKTIIHDSLMTYILENVPFVEENIKNAIDIYEWKGNIKKKPKLVHGLEIFECSGINKEKHKVNHAEQFQETGHTISNHSVQIKQSLVTEYNTHEEIQTNLLKRKEKNQFQSSIRQSSLDKFAYDFNNKVKNEIKETKTNSANKILNNISFNCDIYENSVSDTSQEVGSQICSQISINLNKYKPVMNNKSTKNDLRSLSDSYLKLRSKTIKYHNNKINKTHTNNCIVTKKPVKNNLMDTLLTKPNKSIFSQRTGKILRNKNHNSRDQQLRTCIKTQLQEYSKSFPDNFNIETGELRHDGKIHEYKHENSNGSNKTNLKDNDSSSATEMVHLYDKKCDQMKQLINQWCFADPELYSCDSKLILEDENSIVKDLNGTKEIMSHKNAEIFIRNNTVSCTKTESYHSFAHINFNLSSKDTDEYCAITEEKILEWSSKQEDLETMVHINTIQNEYNQLKSQAKENTDYKNINKHCLKETIRHNLKENIEENENSKQSKPNFPHQSTVTIISGFGSKSSTSIPVMLHQLATSGKNRNMKTSTKKDAAVSTSNSWDILRKTKSMMDKAIMCTGIRSIKINKHKKSKQNNHRVSKHISETLNNNQDALNGKKVDNQIPLILNDGEKDIMVKDLSANKKHKSLHGKIQNSDKKYLGIKQSKPPFTSVDEMSECVQLSLERKGETFMNKEELEDVKIKFKDNFKFVNNNENLDSSEPKGIWNSLRNSSYRFCRFLQQSGSFKLCFKNSMFR